MDNQNKQIAITLTKLDDMEVVIGSLDKFFNALFVYYLNKKDWDKVEILALSAGSYFGAILNSLGYTKDYFEKNDEDL